MQVWNRVRKISSTHIYPHKWYLNEKDGVPITDPKGIANEHAAAFTDNPSFAHYSARFQTIREEDERVQIDLTYDKTFRLRDPRRSILKAKPHAPGLDGIHNWNISLRTHWKSSKISWITSGPQETFHISGEQQPWSPFQKSNKDHTDPLSYRPIALTNCLCKILDCMLNTWYISYHEKSGILDRSQCGFRKHHSTMDPLVILDRYVRDAFAIKQQAIGLFFYLEKVHETTWQYGIIRDPNRIGLRHSIKYQTMTTGPHPQCWPKTGTYSSLHQPSLQYVHEGQWSSFWRTSLEEAVHALLPENSHLYWQPSISCSVWNWLNHKRSVSSQAKCKRRHDPTPDPSRWSQARGSHDTCTGLGSEADCLFSCQNISGIAEFESESGPHSLMNSTQRKVSQLVVSWLWHVLDWRLMSCPLVLPKTSSEHSLWMTWRSVSVDAPCTP